MAECLPTDRGNTILDLEEVAALGGAVTSGRLASSRREAAPTPCGLRFFRLFWW